MLSRLSRSLTVHSSTASKIFEAVVLPAIDISVDNMKHTTLTIISSTVKASSTMPAFVFASRSWYSRYRNVAAGVTSSPEDSVQADTWEESFGASEAAKNHEINHALLE